MLRLTDSDMETRKRTRDQAWGVGTWSDTVQEVLLWAFPFMCIVLTAVDGQARSDDEVGYSDPLPMEPAPLIAYS